LNLRSQSNGNISLCENWHRHGNSSGDLFLLNPFFVPKFFSGRVHSRGSARLAFALGLACRRASGTAGPVARVM
jgi:hypothetical protein